MDDSLRDTPSSLDTDVDVASVLNDADAPNGAPADGADQGSRGRTLQGRAAVGDGSRLSTGVRPSKAASQRTGRGVYLSECACQQGGGGLVYALGEMGYDFGTQARFDAIDGELDEGKFAGNPRDLLEFLTAEKGVNLHFAAAILWTLNHDTTPFYVIRPEGPFARETYLRLLEFYQEQIDSEAERVSIPGTIDGNVTLLSGQVVPVLIPDLRAMYNWRTAALVANVVGPAPKSATKADEDSDERRQYESKMEGMRGFLERIYFELRNTGQTPQERALNFAATNAFNVERVFESASRRELQLDEIGVEPSPICRMDSDCWDVRLVFFDPQDALGHARSAYRFTVDVSDVVPVLVGPVRAWAVR
jgi:cyanobactin maturation PatA/PatG family protease